MSLPLSPPIAHTTLPHLIIKFNFKMFLGEGDWESEFQSHLFGSAQWLSEQRCLLLPSLMVCV